jgi:hypothetical protein
MRKKDILNQKGQSMIEFILTLTFSLGVVFLFFTLARNLTTGYLAHYVNYITSRTYLSYDGARASVENSISIARTRATDVYKRYKMETFGIGLRSLKFLKPGPGGPGSSLMVGTTLQFEKEISSFSAVGGNQKATFLTESFLGKEPTRRECYEMICTAMGITGCGSNYDVSLFDNGC